MITLDLPWPPSVNHYWRHLTRGPLAGRVLISEAGREYRRTVSGEVLAALGRRTAPIQGRLSVEVLANPPDARKRDLDNLPKAIFDALTHAGIWPDDSNIDRLLIERGEKVKGGAVRVTINQIARAV